MDNTSFTFYDEPRKAILHRFVSIINYIANGVNRIRQDVYEPDNYEHKTMNEGLLRFQESHEYWKNELRREGRKVSKCAVLIPHDKVLILGWKMIRENNIVFICQHPKTGQFTIQGDVLLTDTEDNEAKLSEMLKNHNEVALAYQKHTKAKIKFLENSALRK